MQISVKLFLVIALGVSSANGVSIVVNGGFESGPGAPAGGFRNLLAGDLSLPGWTIGGDSVDIHHTGHTNAHSGLYSLDLAGPDLPGSISQDLSTVAGGQYILSFWYAAHAYHPYPGNAMATVSWGGSQLGVLSLPASPAFQAMNWTHYQVQIAASGASTSLVFAATTPNGSIILDDISVESVPAPGASLLLLLAGLGARRRR